MTEQAKEEILPEQGKDDRLKDLIFRQMMMMMMKIIMMIVMSNDQLSVWQYLLYTLLH
jgi:hypothetical protein